MHLTDTPGATSGVCAHRPFTLILSQAYWVALLARRRPCARYCVLLRALVTAAAARGLSGPFSAALALCLGTQAWPHFLRSQQGFPCSGHCAWDCGPQEYWPNASAGLTVADRPMQWSQARRQACGPRDFGAAVTPPASPSLTGRCCVWVDRLTEGLAVTSEGGSHTLQAPHVLVRLTSTLMDF